jgi:hypothetical protein
MVTTTYPLPNYIETFDDRKFIKYFAKIYKNLQQMEVFKHLAPRFSNSVIELAQGLSLAEAEPDTNDNSNDNFNKSTAKL